MDINEYNHPLLTVYPNPTAANVFISNSSQQVLIIELYNTIGELIIQETSSQSLLKLSIKSLSAGVYNMKVLTNNEPIALIKL